MTENKKRIYPTIYLFEKFIKNQIKDCSVLWEYPVSTNYIFEIRLNEFIVTYKFLKYSKNFGISKHRIIDHFKVENINMLCYMELTDEQVEKFNTSDYMESDIAFTQSLFLRL